MFACLDGVGRAGNQGGAVADSTHACRNRAATRCLAMTRHQSALSSLLRETQVNGRGSGIASSSALKEACGRKSQGGWRAIVTQAPGSETARAFVIWDEGEQRSCKPVREEHRPKRPPGRKAARATAASPTGALSSTGVPPALMPSCRPLPSCQRKLASHEGATARDPSFRWGDGKFAGWR